jgi:hypothetical protein
MAELETIKHDCSADQQGFWESLRIGFGGQFRDI